MSAVVTMQRAVGCVVGSAVGDALGAPFEFGPPHKYSQTYPVPKHGGTGEMTGGGGFHWDPGQFTDDNEMAVVVAESLLACGGIDAEDQLTRFRAWSAKAHDVGNLTRHVLASGLPAVSAATTALVDRHGRHTAGNGSLMRAAPGAVRFASAGRDATVAAALQLSAVTHADPLCQWAVAVQHDMIRVALDGRDPTTAIDGVLALAPADVRDVYTPLLSPSWVPNDRDPGNGSAMGALAQAVWSLRLSLASRSFADTVTRVIDLGDDTDSVAAVAGALAGATFGIQNIPSRWLAYVHGRVAGVDGHVHSYDHLALQHLAMELIGWPDSPMAKDFPVLAPREVSPGLWATNRSGARTAPDDWAMVSLCRIDATMRRPVRRETFLVDQSGDWNPALAVAVDDVLDSIDALLAEGRQVVVHCHAGQSRTGLVLAAHLMRHGRSLAEAWDLLAEKWPHANAQNPRFADELERRDRLMLDMS